MRVAMLAGERRTALSFALRVRRVRCVSRVAGVLVGRCGCGRERRAAGARACSKLSVQTRLQLATDQPWKGRSMCSITGSCERACVGRRAILACSPACARA